MQIEVVFRQLRLVRETGVLQQREVGLGRGLAGPHAAADAAPNIRRPGSAPEQAIQPGNACGTAAGGTAAGAARRLGNPVRWSEGNGGVQTRMRNALRSP